jgi:high-affinity Fe2+/Pb2+ permease
VAERSQAGARDVVIVAAVAVGAVLGAAILTSLLPEGVQRFLFHEPVTIAVLVAGTALVLWRVATRRPPEA